MSQKILKGAKGGDEVESDWRVIVRRQVDITFRKEWTEKEWRVREIYETGNRLFGRRDPPVTEKETQSQKRSGSNPVKDIVLDDQWVDVGEKGRRNDCLEGKTCLVSTRVSQHEWRIQRAFGPLWLTGTLSQDRSLDIPLRMVHTGYPTITKGLYQSEVSVHRKG